MLDLWQREDGRAAATGRPRAASCCRRSERVTRWYEEFATSLPTRSGRPSRSPTTTPPTGAWSTPCAAISASEDGTGERTAVRMIWTGDHLDAARGMQALLLEPAHTAAEAHALSMFARMRPWRPA